MGLVLLTVWPVSLQSVVGGCVEVCGCMGGCGTVELLTPWLMCFLQFVLGVYGCVGTGQGPTACLVFIAWDRLSLSTYHSTTVTG